MHDRRTVEVALFVRHRKTGRLSDGSGRLPRVARLMALAIRCEELVRSRVVRNYTDIAELGNISKARATQIMNLLNLAPDIQERLLSLPATTLPRDALTERHLRAVTALVSWEEQRAAFDGLVS